MVLLYQYAFHILAFFLEDSRREEEKHFDIPAAHDRISTMRFFTKCRTPILHMHNYYYVHLAIGNLAKAATFPEIHHFNKIYER